MMCNRKHAANIDDLKAELEKSYADLCQCSDGSYNTSAGNELLEFSATPEGYAEAIEFARRHRIPLIVRIQETLFG